MERERLIPDIREQVRHNCNVSDARSWGYYSICGLLLRYRDMYRSEHGLQPWDSIPGDDIASWIEERETVWKHLENADFADIILAGNRLDPFAVDDIMFFTEPCGLLYGAGYGAFGKPTFLLARITRKEERLDYLVRYTGDEHGRDLSASPAMVQGRCITIRLAIVRTILWEKICEWAGKSKGNARENPFDRYGLSVPDPAQEQFHERFETAVADAAEMFVLHEIGEATEDEEPEEWCSLLDCTRDKFTHLHCRGIKDIIADTGELGPLRTMISTNNRSLLGLYFVFLDGIRRELFPEFRKAYELFSAFGNLQVIDEACSIAGERARRMRKELLGIVREAADDADAAARVRAYFNRR